MVFFFKKFFYIFFYKVFNFVAPQEGENIILERIFAKKYKGFFVDVGAHHPIRFSNTIDLYNRGWNGINIEPNDDIIRLFDKLRSRDTNINLGISSEIKKATYYKFREPALNTIDKKICDLRVKQGFKVISKKNIQITTLKKILDEQYKKKKFNKIDLLKIDVEGHELEVLKSNNWNKYSPQVIICELINVEFSKLFKNKVYIYLKKKITLCIANYYKMLFSFINLLLKNYLNNFF